MLLHYENRDIPAFLDIQTKLMPLPHLHKEIEVVYVEEGKTEVMADRFNGFCEEGDVFITFPNQIHSYHSTEGKFYVAIFSADILFESATYFKNYTPENNIVHLQKDSVIPQFFREAVKSERPFAANVLYGYLNLIISEILPEIKLYKTISSEQTLFKNILNYCIKNYTNDLSLETLAKDLHFSKYYISHTMHENLGFSFNDYIHSLRIAEACDLLKNGNKKISDIASDVGYDSIRSFNRVFLKIKGKTPGEYREMHKKI